MPVFAPGELGPGADLVDQALGGGLAAFMEEAGFEAQARPDARGADRAAALGAKAAVLVGLGKRDELTRRRRAQRRPRRSPGGRRRCAAVATTLLDAVPASWTRSRWRRRSPRASRSAATSTSPYKSDGKPSKLKRGDRARPGRRARSRPALERGRHRERRGDLGARPGEHAGRAEVAGGVRARPRRRCCAGKGVKVEVLEGAALKKEKLGGVLGVGQGSEQPAAHGEDDVRAARREGDGRARRQGRRVRLRRPLAQDRRPAWRR